MVKKVYYADDKTLNKIERVDEHLLLNGRILGVQVFADRVEIKP